MTITSNRWLRNENSEAWSLNSWGISLPPYEAELEFSTAIMVRLLTAGRILWEGLARSLILPTPDGEIAILRGHADLTTTLDIGVLRVRTDKEKIAWCIIGGFAQIEAGEAVAIALKAELGNEIDPQLVKAALEEAEANFNRAATYQEKLRAKKSLKLAQARWQALPQNWFD